MIRELYVILMMIADNGIVQSANHSTASTHLNAYKDQQTCEAELPKFVSVAYSEFHPKLYFRDHRISMTGAAGSPEGLKYATWRCA